MAYWGIATVNAFIAHIVPMLLSGTVNPGAIQSAFLMGPLGLYFFSRTFARFGPRTVAMALVFGGPVAHVAGMLLPLRLVRSRLLSEASFACVWTGALLLPVIVSFLGRARRRKAR